MKILSGDPKPGILDRKSVFYIVLDPFFGLWSVLWFQHTLEYLYRCPIDWESLIWTPYSRIYTHVRYLFSNLKSRNHLGLFRASSIFHSDPISIINNNFRGRWSHGENQLSRWPTIFVLSVRRINFNKLKFNKKLKSFYRRGFV